MTSTPQCSNCFFSFVAPASADTTANNRGASLQSLRFCNRQAPSADAQNPNGWLWPQVADDWWCGEGADAITGTAYDALVNDASGWQDYISTIGCASGSFTTAGTNVARFLTSGTLIFFYLQIAIDAGTAMGPLTFTLPSTPSNDSVVYGASSTNLKSYWGLIAHGTAVVETRDATGDDTITTDTFDYAGFYEA